MLLRLVRDDGHGCAVIPISIEHVDIPYGVEAVFAKITQTRNQALVADSLTPIDTLYTQYVYMCLYVCAILIDSTFQ